MIISTFVEGFKWNLLAVIGMIILLYSVWIGVRPKIDYSNDENNTILKKMFHLLVK